LGNGGRRIKWGNGGQTSDIGGEFLAREKSWHQEEHGFLPSVGDLATEDGVFHIDCDISTVFHHAWLLKERERGQGFYQRLMSDWVFTSGTSRLQGEKFFE